MRYKRERKLRARGPAKTNLEHLMILATFPCGILKDTSVITVATTNNFYFYFSNKAVEVHRGQKLA